MAGSNAAMFLAFRAHVLRDRAAHTERQEHGGERNRAGAAFPAGCPAEVEDGAVGPAGRPLLLLLLAAKSPLIGPAEAEELQRGQDRAATMGGAQNEKLCQNAVLPAQGEAPLVQFRA